MLLQVRGHRYGPRPARRCTRRLMMTWQYMGAGLVLLASLGGCMVGPNYHAPQVPVPATWSAGHLGGAAGQAAVTTQWWTTFQDALLESLIARAVQANLDLRTAAARVREARAQRGVTAADLWPTLHVSGSYTRQRASEHARTLPSGAASNAAGGGGQSAPLEQNLFQTGFDARW